MTMCKYNLLLNLKFRRSCIFQWKCHARTFSNDQVVELAYKVHEELPADSSKSAPILILHGALGCKTNWNSLSRAINRATQRKVIALDARGHGDSPHHPDLSYQAMSEDLLHFMRSHGYPKATVIGHSMGGRSAMAAALKQPQMVERLIVVDVSPVDNKDPHTLPASLKALLALKINTSVPLAKARQQADYDLAHSIGDRNLRQFLLTNLVADKDGSAKWQSDLQRLADNFHHIRGFPLSSFEGKQYRGPTIFIGGAASNYLRLEDHPTIRKYFPSAQFHSVGGAGHWVHADKPQEFLEVVCTFITRLNKL